MSERVERWVRQPLLSDRPAADNRAMRALLLLAWAATTLWLAAHHVPWRDEVRALSLTLAASGWADLFRVVHGEGHPYLWYVLLRAAHDLFGVREVLPAVGLLVGLGAAALLALKSPFRLGLIALLLFSHHLGFDYSVVARNYGLSALLLFAIACWYRQVANSAWFGVLLLLLCNTNAPAVLLAGALFLYRMIEVAAARPGLRSRAATVLLVNFVLLMAGVLLCFLAIYPPVNDAAAASGRMPLTPANLLGSLVDAERSFGALGFDNALFATHIFMLLSLALFIGRWPALIAVSSAFLALKLFFFFAFPAAYRHAALLLLFLVAMLWIEGDKQRPEPARTATGSGSMVALVACWGFIGLLAMQSILYVRWPILATLQGKPWSHAADLAALAARPEYRGAVMMFDPDALGESVVYQTGQPFWLLRQGRLGTVASFGSGGKRHIGLEDMLRDAARLHAGTRRPVLIVLKAELGATSPGRYDVMYGDTTDYSHASIARFRAQTREVASFRGTYGDEEYDVYRFPR
nr:hypothetical protein [uncultured Sphingomonas sp.]